MSSTTGLALLVALVPPVAPVFNGLFGQATPTHPPAFYEPLNLIPPGVVTTPRIPTESTEDHSIVVSIGLSVMVFVVLFFYVCTRPANSIILNNCLWKIDGADAADDALVETGTLFSDLDDNEAPRHNDVIFPAGL